jgi:hypothetical protein
MLNDRRNCFLGRNNGFEGLLLWPLLGDPFRNELPDMLPKALPSRGGPIRDEAEGLLADWGRRSWVGDSLKHSSSDIDVVDNLLSPAPKRKGGNWLSALRGPKDPVEKPLVRASVGRIRIDFRRLYKLET